MLLKFEMEVGPDPDRSPDFEKDCTSVCLCVSMLQPFFQMLLHVFLQLIPSQVH